ncbi:hypothetical protein AAVH_03012 [Aphelenchoides avenae]|nr:hypothetical protein AAVH_03012 [Aphelenchus avenae]
MGQVQVALILCLVFAASLAQILQNPTFRFTANPPVSWTYWDGTIPPGHTVAIRTYPGQWTSQGDAQRTMDANVKASILQALQRSNLPIGGLRTTSFGYTPEAVPINDTDILPGTYIQELGAVTYLRTGTTGAGRDPYIKSFSIGVQNGPLATLQQWQFVANQLYNYLTFHYNVHFTSPIQFQ